MFAFTPVSAFTGVSVRPAASAVCTRPARVAGITMMSDIHEGPGKGFGGGEATRNPDATEIDPNDPKGKQKAIHPGMPFMSALCCGPNFVSRDLLLTFRSFIPCFSITAAETFADYQARVAREKAGK
jgi:hypothetical protein